MLDPLPKYDDININENKKKKSKSKESKGKKYLMLYN